MRSVMKKIIAILLLSSLLLLSLTGCLAEDKNKETEAPTEVPTDAPTEKPSEDNEPTEAPTDNNEPPEPEDDDIIPVLVEYLKNRYAGVELPIVSSADKINQIKKGQRALHVAFDPSSYYLVCGYYEDSSFEESALNRHVDEYTWVKYENENEIREEHEGLGFVVAFQVNRAFFAKDIMLENAKSLNMEHFQIYLPEFINGLNAKAAEIFDETFIYLDSTGKNTIYYSTSYDYHRIRTFPCVYFNEKYYLSIQLYTVYLSSEYSGHYSKWKYEDDFGEYYEDLFSLMRADNMYTEVTENERIHFYGLVEIDDFVDIVNK